MSSSDEDSSDYYDASPEVQAAPARSTRRKANTPSPRKVPKKKAKALADSNVAIEDSDEDDSVADSDEDAIVTTRKNVRNSNVRGKKRPATVSVQDGNESGASGSSRSTEETENRPPPIASYILNADIPEESSQPAGGNGEHQGPTRSRKRLSIRSEGSMVGEGRRSSMSNAESVVPTPSEVQTIYETCSQMFNANRISPQNAFNLRLLDCINQMINSPSYDKSNMQLTSSTVEIGTKIYVCRVDNTHSAVLSLASDITLQQQRKRKKDGGRDADDGNQEEGGAVDGEPADADGLDDEENEGRRQRTKKKVMKKRGKFVEEDNSKLLTGLEEQNVKFVTRRNFLKKKFNEMIYDDLDFDYLSYFLEPEDEHPLQTESEETNMKGRMVIPETYVNQIEMNRLDYLPFSYTEKFDPESQDIWGISLNAIETNRHEMSHGPQLPMDDGYAYDPAERPDAYPDEGPQAGDMNDTIAEALPHFGEDGDNGDIPAVSFHDIRSLDNLDNYFQRIRNLLKDTTKSKYGWCGPNFVRPKTTWGAQLRGVKKPKVRKEPEKFDFNNIDWSDKANKFAPNQNLTAARTVFDDKIIEAWGTQKVIIPFLGIELNDDEFDPMDFENENDPKYIPNIFKLFLSRNRSILDLLRVGQKRERHGSGTSGPPSVGEDGFDHDNDIELPRDIAEDFCSQPMADDGFIPPDGSAPPEAGWQFPGSMPGLLNDDPLSAVSGIDSIRFSRKPKPIDMSALKKAILKTLSDKLSLDESGKPLLVEETAINLAELMYYVLQQIGSRTEKLMSVPIFVVALMHVVADKKLFVIYDEKDPDCPMVICRGKDFNHADHIPMPEGGFDME